jgi:hypothetical protein
VRRRLVNLLTAISLLLCVATMVLWARSYSGASSISRTQVRSNDGRGTKNRTHEIQLGVGQIRFVIRDQTVLHIGRFNPPWNGQLPSTRPADMTAHWSYIPRGTTSIGEIEPGSVWDRLGFNRRTSGWVTSSASVDYRTWTIPIWLLTLLLAVPPALRAPGIYSQRQRKLLGQCIACGYDLRATPDRCPECGAIVAASPPALQ